MNPFLDSQNPPETGSVTMVGYELNQLEFPLIPTLVKRTELMPDVPLMTEALRLPGKPTIPINNVPQVGLALDLPMGLDILGEINPAQQTTQPGVNKIPTNWDEARKSLHLISTGRPTKRTPYFGFSDLKIIARNLNLESAGTREKKEALATRLREAIIAYHGLKE